jgi:hypothetical protein
VCSVVHGCVRGVLACVCSAVRECVSGVCVGCV